MAEFRVFFDVRRQIPAVWGNGGAPHGIPFVMLYAS